MPDDYQRIATAIRFIKESSFRQPSLNEVAEHLGLSPYHFQRLFHRFAGVSPKRFLQHLTTEHAKRLLKQSIPILETSFDVGLSSPGRLHDLLVSVEAVTPGQYRSGGKDLCIRYGIQTTPLGNCFIATTKRGICRLEFIDEMEEDKSATRLAEYWPNAHLIEDKKSIAKVIRQIFYCQKEQAEKPLTLLLQGTNFQLKVWQALLKIPEGTLISYGDLAQRIGHPKASRAIGTAIGNNPIGYLIPCHRVLRADGEIGGYRWGVERKLAILGRELGKSY
jgi:AraC family transcriptional regulator of adaptative response/methylated-DNA-[protein]-cysteine methyltransferase